MTDSHASMIFRMVIFKWIVWGLIFFSCTTHHAYGQQDSSSTPPLKIGLSTVYSPSSFEAWGKIKNSSSLSFKLQVWHSNLSAAGINSRIGSELILVQHLKYPENGTGGTEIRRVGFGLIPAKLLFAFGSSTIKPFTSISSGFIFFNDKLPAKEGASFNYLINAEIGFEILVTEFINLHVGYGLNHTSNGNSANLNPGIDSHTLSLSIVI
ncbi:MAG: hypothetical protein GVY08_05730 [Bacteroidetes bacterium]|nr:hypothetical protein [Bacteroidota bacterium]